MKKSLALLLAVALMLVAAGCGKKAIEGGDPGNKQTATTPGTSTTTPSNSSGSTTPAPEQKQTFLPPEPKPAYQRVNLGPLKVAEPAKIGPLTVIVDERAVVAKAAGLPPNYLYVVMKVTIKNEGKDEYTINTTDHFKMETPEGKLMPFNVQATAHRTPRLQGTLEGGKTQTGWLGYLVKAQAGQFKFRFTHPDWGDVVWQFTAE